jgi:raffinose/stachyose/melibiose transport system substrate-binding protein
MFEHRTTRARGWVAALAVMTIAAGGIAAPVAAQDETPSCGTEPVELLAYLETGFPFANALVEEFQKQFPNVTVNVREDQFSNLIAQTPLLLTSDNPPDLIRLPTMVGLVKDGLLLNLVKKHRYSPLRWVAIEGF